MQGLTDEQVVELKLKDEWADRCTPQGGVRENPDKVGVRNGQGKPDRHSRILTRHCTYNVLSKNKKRKKFI